MQYVNFSEKKLIQTEPSHVSDRIKDTNDPDMNFLIFQQSRMEKEINNLRHELGKSSLISIFNLFLESFAIKSKETYSMELKNCLKISSDIRNEMSSNVLSLEDKLRQTQVRKYFLHFRYFLVRIEPVCRKTAARCQRPSGLQKRYGPKRENQI